MQKFILSAMLLMASTSFAQQKVIVDKGNYQIVAEEVSEPANITFRNPQLVVNNKAYTLSSSRMLDTVMREYCQSETPFKYLYVSNEMAGVFSGKSAKIMDNGTVTLQRNETVVVMMACTQTDY